MKPKTKIQKKVVELSSKLKPISDKQEAYAFQHCFYKFFVRSRRTIYCMECGHSWKEIDATFMYKQEKNKPLPNLEVSCTCPSCNTKLMQLDKYATFYRDIEYYAILDTKEDFQIVRMFWVAKILKKGKVPKFLLSEVMQHWIEPSGRTTTMSKGVHGFSHCYDNWNLSTEMEVRSNTFSVYSRNNDQRYNLSPYKIYPSRKVLPIIKRNGFKGRFHDIAPQVLFSLLLFDKYAETLLKLNQIDLLHSYLKYSATDIRNNWSTLKICFRNKYIIHDAQIYFDYIKCLRYFGKDILNSKYVCPENLMVEHDRLFKKKIETEKRKALEEKRNRNEEAQIDYVSQKAMFFGLLFKEEEIEIKPLLSVEEFMIEGDELGHCVYGGDYYKKNDSLILSAQIANKRIETIEFSLTKLEVVQSRGFKNQPTPYHDRILNIVKNNIPHIARLIPA